MNSCFIFLIFFLQDERFNHDIDVLTGYKTRTLLCMPIKDTNGDVVGVAQVRLILLLLYDKYLCFNSCVMTFSMSIFHMKHTICKRTYIYI